MKTKYNFLTRIIKLFVFLAIPTIVFNGCQDDFKYDLPDSNSKIDTILPNANFSYASTLEDFKTVKFTNLSGEATNYLWDFGGGNTSEEQDPIYTFSGEGTYPVTLTASDGRGESDLVTIEVMVVEGPFQPIILEPGFEDNSLPDGTGDGRDSWRSALGGVIQITSDPVAMGDQGAKLPSDGTRAGYQEIAVEPNSNYDIRFWYTMKDDATDPFVVVSIIGVTEFGPIETPEQANQAVLSSVTVNDTSDPAEFLEQKLSFNSGENNTVGIYFYNGNVEARLDDFSIEIGAVGAVPPSVGFDIEQSESNYLEYTFTNTSSNADTYMWDFGDGNTSTEESPTHIYDTFNKYNVTLEVTSADGLSASLEKTIDIQKSVTADFTLEINENDFRTVHFMDASIDAVMLLWEFGDGFQFTGMNPSHTYDEEGVYTITLTAYSVTGVISIVKKDVTIAMGFVPINPVVLNGDFTDGQDNWKIGSFTGGTTSPFNSSSDGSSIDYSGVDTGSKTGGAKWTMSTSAGVYLSENTRFGYQAFTVSPNEKYIVEWAYAIKNDVDDAEGGDRLGLNILDGHFSDGQDALSANTLVETVGAEALGKGNFTVIKQEFQSNDSGEIAIWLYGVTNEDAYADNVKLYPK